MQLIDLEHLLKKQEKEIKKLKLVQEVLLHELSINKEESANKVTLIKNGEIIFIYEN